MLLPVNNEHFKIFYDKECTREVEHVTVEDVDRPVFTFGKIVEVGDTGMAIRYIKNMTSSKIVKLQFTPDDVELSIAAPDTLFSFEVGTITVAWTPSLDRETALNTSIKAKYKRVISV